MDTNHSWNPFKVTMKEKRATIAKAHALSKSENKHDTTRAKLFQSKRDSDRYDRQMDIKKSKGISIKPKSMFELRRKVKDMNDTKAILPIAHGITYRERKEAREKRRAQAKSHLKST